MTASLQKLRDRLERHAGRRWEIWLKEARVKEYRIAGTRLEESERKETGCAARWQGAFGPSFAAASTPEELAENLPRAEGILSVREQTLPEMPSGTFPEPAGLPVIPLPEWFEPLAQLLASESRGEARLVSLTLTSGTVTETLENGSGFSGVRRRAAGYGSAQAVGACDNRRVTARLLFPIEPESAPELPNIARTLRDRCVIPLRGETLAWRRGELLLDPEIVAAMLAATLPLFCGNFHRHLLSRKYLDHQGRFAASEISLVDDATGLLPFDGEGTPCRANGIIEDGHFRKRLHDLTSAGEAREAPTGNASRPSFQMPPAPGSERLALKSANGLTSAQMLAQVTRGLYASALVEPARVDLQNDFYDLAVEGWAVEKGQARAPVARAHVRGRLSEFWRGITAAGDDRRWFLYPTLVGAPTLLLQRAAFPDGQ